MTIEPPEGSGTCRAVGGLDLVLDLEREKSGTSSL